MSACIMHAWIDKMRTVDAILNPMFTGTKADGPQAGQAHGHLRGQALQFSRTAGPTHGARH
eukprot:19538-Chlamydomonas_euryale.AAC.1